MAAVKNSQQKIKPCLWFDNNAEEAVKYYTSIFKRSKIKTISHYGKGAPMPEGTVLTVDFDLEGQEFLALNGGRFTNSRKRFHIWCIAKHKKKLITTGINYLKVEKKFNAVG
ncbi:MAG: hypothetical protein JWN78_1324 [Bacteroidota bacterium]|nr:hypothetical protein [Bacteroidota bacterium]